MRSDGNIWALLALLADWFPMLLLVGVWIFFMKRMQVWHGSSPALMEQKRHNDALEKILANHEERLLKLEEGKGRPAN